MTCALCRRRADYGRLCGHHSIELGRLLDTDNIGTVINPDRPGWQEDPYVLPSIPALYAQLDAQPARRTDGSAVNSGFFRSSPPGDMQIWALRDERTRTDGVGRDDHDHERVLSVPTTLWAIVARVNRADVDGRLEQRPDHTVQAVCAWLYNRREWLAEQTWVDDTWRTLRALHSQLRGAWGDPNMKPVGTCVQLVDDDGLNPDGPWRCATPLYMPEQPPKSMDEPIRVIPNVRCGWCGWTYHGPELGRLVREREVMQHDREAAS